MRYEGTREQVQAVESELLNCAICFRRKIRTFDNEFGVEIPVETRVFDVLPNKEAILIPVRFFYDKRDGTATLDVTDKREMWLRKLSPNIAKKLDCLCIQRQQ